MFFFLMVSLHSASSLLPHVLRSARLSKGSARFASAGATAGATSHKHDVIFVLGGPGSGKGTQCGRLVDEFGLTHLSVGELLREARTSGSSDGKLIDEYIKEGKIVPVALSLGLLRKAMDGSASSRPILVDGFPRNADNVSASQGFSPTTFGTNHTTTTTTTTSLSPPFAQVEGWDALMHDAADVQCCLFLDCPEEEQEKRLLLRGETSGRSDDNLESARKRFKTYLTETMPVVEHFEKQGKLRRVAAELSPDAVYELTRAAVIDLIE